MQPPAGPATLLKKRPLHRCFPVNFAKFLRTPYFTEHLQTTASVSMNRLHFCYTFLKHFSFTQLSEL